MQDERVIMIEGLVLDYNIYGTRDERVIIMEGLVLDYNIYEMRG